MQTARMLPPFVLFFLSILFGVFGVGFVLGFGVGAGFLLGLGLSVGFMLGFGVGVGFVAGLGVGFEIPHLPDFRA